MADAVPVGQFRLSSLDWTMPCHSLTVAQGLLAGLRGAIAAGVRPMA